MPCDAACMKIIINTSGMAALAPLLASQFKEGHPIGAAAKRLGLVTGALTKLLAIRGHVPDPNDTSVCDQAEKLLGWIRGVAPEDSVAEMNSWTSDALNTIGEVVAGTFGTPPPVAAHV